MIKAGLICLLGLLISQFCPAQSAQFMVKQQPFPYAQGVAMDTLLYQKVRARLLAADSLALAADNTIKALQAEILANRKARDEQFRLGQYDAAKAKTLLVQANVLQAQLTTAQDLLREAKLARDEIVKQLPRKTRRALVDATPEQIARSVVDYIDTLQARKWKWLAAGGGIGFVLGLVILF